MTSIPLLLSSASFLPSVAKKYGLKEEILSAGAKFGVELFINQNPFK